MEQIIKVLLERIKHNPYQPESRIEIPEELAAKFGQSILEHGLLQVPVVRRDPTQTTGLISEPKYQMGDGWLRFAGYKWLVANGHTEFNEIPVRVVSFTDRQMADLVLEANSCRQDMTPIDRAKLFRKILDDFGITQAELARVHNISQGEVANTIRLLELPALVQDKIISQEITETHARQLLRLNQMPDMQQKLLAETIKGGISVNQLSNEIQRGIYNASLNLEPDDYPKPVFDVKECEGCADRQKVGMPYDAGKKTWRCMKKSCYEQKTELAEKAKVADMEAVIAASNKEAAGKKKGGMLDLAKLTWRDYQELDAIGHKIDNPGECRNCPRRAVGKGYSGRVETVCVDVKCFKAKEKICTDKAAAIAKEAERQLTERVKKACDGVDDVLAGLKLISGHLVTHSRKDTREKYARMMSFKEHDLKGFCFGVTDQKWLLRRIVALVLTLERYEGDKGAFQKLLADLEGTSDDLNKALDAHRAKHCQGCANDNDNRDCRQLLARYGNGYKDKCYHKTMKTGDDEARDDEDEEEEPTPAPSSPEPAFANTSVNTSANTDPLADLEIRIAQEEGGYHTFQLGKINVSDTSLKGCVCWLGHKMNWGATVEKTLATLQAFPASTNRDLLIGIIEGTYDAAQVGAAV